MQKKSLKLLVVCILLIFSKVSSQEEINLNTSSVDGTLLEGANAIVRSEEIVIEINSINSMTIKTKRIVTVLDKFGDGYANYSEGYDPSRKIKKLQVIVYDASGKEIKNYKKKDFIDRSVYDGISLMNDNRVKLLDYTPVSYPYTMAFESEVQNSTTAFIAPWYPVPGYKIGVQKSSYKILNPKAIPLRIKETNFEGYQIQKNKTNEEVLYSISNVLAKRPEVYTPSLYDMIPIVKVVPKSFSLEGIKGSATDWKSLGKWEYDNLIAGRDQLPKETIEEIDKLVSKAKNKREKAKLIYKYVQDKTRYISIQLGIGGLMPFLASDVDKWGYGDCKALTNYTKALLDSQNILSYYTELYAGNEKRSIDKEFASIEGNHVILNIPDENGDIWLECTNQTLPFDFIGSFTDDRDVLVLKPEGGEIKRTRKYEPRENVLQTTATVNLGIDNSMVSNIKREARGLEYDEIYGIQYQEPKEQKLYYKKHWAYINGLEIKDIKFVDNKDSIVFTENIKVSCVSYGKKAGTRLLVTPNVFSCDQSNLPMYDNRQTSLVIPRGYINTDEYSINIPTGYVINNIPEKKAIQTEFGEYTYELEKVSESQIKFRRFLKIIDGTFPKEKYEEYRKFRAKIKKADNSRIVLKKQLTNE